MTLRSVILGLLGALALASLGYVNDQVILLESLASGSLLPISVLGLLIVLAMLVNPLLFWLRLRRLSQAELATIVVLMLAACSVIGSGLVNYFTPALMMPLHYNHIRPGWQAKELLGYAPAQALPNDGQYDDRIVTGFLQGWGRPGQPIGPLEVPWAAWQGPLATWLPLVLLLAVCGACMAVIVHRQWSQREHLRYPIAELATALSAQQPGKAAGVIFRNKLFWLGLGLVLGIRLLNGLSLYCPLLPSVPLAWDFMGVRDLFLPAWRTEFGHWLLQPKLYPTVVAFTFFLSGEIALSLGLSQWIFVPIGSVLVAYGVDMKSDYMAGGITGFQRFGSYAAMALLILYMGRRYYSLVLRQAVTFRPHAEVESTSAWACRIGVVSACAMGAMLVLLGLDWPLAAITVLILLMTLLVVSRVTAETGLFMIQPRWETLGVLLGLLGIYALGPGAIVIIGLACVVLSLYQGSTLMPHLVNGLKLADNAGIPPRRMAPAVVASFALCLVVAVAVALWANYNFGVKENDFTTNRVPNFTFRIADEAVNKLDAWGELDASKGLSPLARLTSAQPEGRFLWSAGAGFVLVLLLGAARQRWPRWPLHPVILLVVDTYPAASLNHSFLLGWLLRSGMSRYAGFEAIRRVRPFMIGVIAGDLLGGAIFMAAGALSYALTGQEPPRMEIFP